MDKKLPIPDDSPRFSRQPNGSYFWSVGARLERYFFVLVIEAGDNSDIRLLDSLPDLRSYRPLYRDLVRCMCAEAYLYWCKRGHFENASVWRERYERVEG